MASHCLCRFNMKKNVRNRFKNDKMITIFDHASKVYRTSKFYNQMKKLKKIHKMAYRYLLESDVHKWSRAYSLIRHYSLITKTIVELLNSTLRMPTSCQLLHLWSLSMIWCNDGFMTKEMQLRWQKRASKCVEKTLNVA